MVKQKRESLRITTHQRLLLLDYWQRRKRKVNDEEKLTLFIVFGMVVAMFLSVWEFMSL